MAFNLLPLPPLDGFHIAETFIPVKYKEQFHQAERYFGFALLGLILIGFFTRFSPLFWLIETIIIPFEYVIKTPIDWLVSLIIK
jgi:Zn-dependent protease